MSDDLLDRRVARARTELRAVLDPAPPDVDVAVGRRHVRRLAVATGMAAMATAAIAAVVWGGGQDTTSTVVADPAPAAGSAFQSAVTPVGGVPTVLVAYAAGAEGGSRVEVLQRDDWRTVASLPVAVPGVGGDRALLVGDVTGDGEPDFVVPLEAASTTPYQVVSNHGGPWRQVAFGATNRVVIAPGDVPSAARLVTTTNLCEPTCADGRSRRERWRYAEAEGRFVVAESAVCEALGDGRWRCDPPGSSLAG